MRRRDEKMKRYRLLKDLPTFSKGDTFRLTDYGTLERESDGDVAFMAPTLEKFNLLDSEWFEEIPEGYKRWRAKSGETYYYIDSEGEVYDDKEQYVHLDDGGFLIGNYFKTREEAEKTVEWLKAFAVLRDDTKGFKPDWGDDEQKKWGVYYAHTMEGLVVDLSYLCQDHIICFATEEDAKASIKKHKCEWLTFFGVEE